MLLLRLQIIILKIIRGTPEVRALENFFLGYLVQLSGILFEEAEGTGRDAALLAVLVRVDVLLKINILGRLPLIIRVNIVNLIHLEHGDIIPYLVLRGLMHLVLIVALCLDEARPF